MHSFWLTIFLLFLSDSLKTQAASQCQLGDLKNCRCDADCFRFKDCCAEAKSKQIPRPFGGASSQGDITQSLSCEYLGVTTHYYTIVRCPRSGRRLDTTPESQRRRELCENGTVMETLETKIPVFDRGLLYRNRYCAECHRVMNYSRPQVPSFRCSGNLTSPPPPNATFEQVKPFFLNRTCYLVMQFAPNEILRECYADVIDRCPANSLVDSEAALRCQLGETWWSRNQTRIFKNQDCCACHKTSCQDSLQLGMHRRPSLFSHSRRGNIFTVVKLFNFYEWFNKSEETSTPITPATPGNETESFSNSSTSQGRSSLLTEVLQSTIVAACLLSILSLLVLLLVYSAISELRNFPGLLTMGLAVSLLIALVAILSALLLNHIPSLCLLLALLQHFFFLASYFWMALFSFDLFKTFRQQSTHSQDANRHSTSSAHWQRFGKFALIAFGCPGVLTLVPLILQFTTPEDFLLNPGYATSSKSSAGCWFSNPAAVFLWFFLPAVTLLFFNTIVVGLLWRHIYRTTRDTAILRQQSRGTASTSSGSSQSAAKSREYMVVMCIKLALIFGGTWTVQLILTALFFVLPVLSLFGGILSGLQGFFITLIFLTSRPTQRRIRQFCGCSAGARVSENRTQEIPMSSSPLPRTSADIETTNTQKKQ